MSKTDPFKAIATHVTFMGIMRDHMDRQKNDPDFDGQNAVYDLYEDLSNLYYSNLT